MPRKGYILKSSPDNLSEKELSPLLTTERIGRKIYSFDSLSSTNDKAKEVAKEGAPEGTVISTDHQTGGRGRSGRKWQSSPKEAIQMSLILRPPLAPSEVASITQIAAAAVALALIDLEFTPEIKWPNDVILSGKKVCGILTEMTCELDHIGYIVMGIGVNVNQPSFPDEIGEIATSLMIEKGKKLERKTLMAKILNHLEVLYDEFCVRSPHPRYLELCRDLSWLKDRSISFELKGQIKEGKVMGIDDEGRLVVDMGESEPIHLLSGEVHLGINQ